MFRFKKLTLSLLLLPTAITTVEARPIYPAEILGRNLQSKVGGSLGHIGLATAPMSSAKGMAQDSHLVIEVLNTPPPSDIIQINDHEDFKSRAPYWGSKYGVADRGQRGYLVLLEANHQRWWCPSYTFDTDYIIGEGNVVTGEKKKCGRWRCDTFVWWTFYSQGWDVMPGSVWTPQVLWSNFPYYNGTYAYTPKSENISSDITLKNLDNVTSDELNDMSFEEFQMIMNAPPTNYVDHAHSQASAQIRFAADPSLNNIKRGIMLDRLISRSVEPDLVKKLLKIYEEEKEQEVKEKIIENLMMYNQKHSKEKEYSLNEQSLIKNFFSDLLNSRSFTYKTANDTLTGFLDTHSLDEIIANKELIDNVLSKASPVSAIMTKYSLVHKSKELQPIYIQSIISQLEKENDSNLDGYFFGPLSMGYQGSGKNLLLPESRKIIEDYLKKISYKYSAKGIKDQPKDIHRQMTASLYDELIENMK